MSLQKRKPIVSVRNEIKLKKKKLKNWMKLEKRKRNVTVENQTKLKRMKKSKNWMKLKIEPQKDIETK